MTNVVRENPLVKDTTAALFRVDVIAESGRQPVLVDFWAPWCEPCKQLTPILEKVVAQAAGKVKLVKMNIDEHPQIAGQLGVQSIPAVFAFQKGQPADGFMGALPESQVKAFVERLVGPLGGEEDDLVAEGNLALDGGNAELALGHFSEALGYDPAKISAIAGLVKANVALGNLVAAKEALSAVPKSHAGDARVIAATAALEVAEQAEAVGDVSELKREIEANPKNHQARFDLAVAMNARGDREGAADSLLEIIRLDRHWNDDGARKQLLQFFDAWGPMDPETMSARRKLSGVLFS